MTSQLDSSNTNSTDIEDINDVDFVPTSGSSYSSSMTSVNTVPVTELRKRKTPNYTPRQLYTAIAFKLAMPTADYRSINKLYKSNVCKDTIKSNIRRNKTQLDDIMQNLSYNKYSRTTESAKLAVGGEIVNAVLKKGYQCRMRIPKVLSFIELYPTLSYAALRGFILTVEKSAVYWIFRIDCYEYNLSSSSNS
jgi:hypothetical protein